MSNQNNEGGQQNQQGSSDSPTHARDVSSDAWLRAARIEVSDALRSE